MEPTRRARVRVADGAGVSAVADAVGVSAAPDAVRVEVKEWVKARVWLKARDQVQTRTEVKVWVRVRAEVPGVIRVNNLMTADNKHTEGDNVLCQVLTEWAFGAPDR
jgi:hypothetical protein